MHLDLKLSISVTNNVAKKCFLGGGIHTLLNLVRPKFEAEGRLVEKGLAAHQPAIWEALQTPLAGLGRFLDRECILDASSTENAASAANVD